jgi:hypothetical protein
LFNFEKYTEKKEKKMRLKNGYFLISTLALFLFSVTAEALPVFNSATNHFYEYFETKLSFEDAMADANSRNFAGLEGHLVTINSHDENIWVSNMGFTMLHDDLHGIWLGAVQEPNSSSPGSGWTWVTGEPWNFTNWFPGEPNDRDGTENNTENNLVFEHEYTTSTGWKWNDHDGLGLRSYIVEYEPAAPSEEDCLVATNSIRLSDRAQVLESNIAAGNSFEMGTCSLVEGDVTVRGNAFLRDQPWCETTIEGDLTLAGTLNSQTNSYTLGGTLTENASIPLITVDSTSVAYGGSDVRQCNTTLLPGSYNDVEIYGNCTIQLSSGTYNVKSFRLHADAKLEVYANSGPVVIYADNEFTYGDRVQLVNNLDPENLIVYTNQNYQVQIGSNSSFIGHLFAPHTRVSVFSNVEYNGCIYAGDITLENNAVFTGSYPVSLP